MAVISDTHLREPGRPGARSLPAAALRWLDRAHLILHAGDVVDSATLEMIAEHGPLHAVLGNNDKSLVGSLPTSLVVDVAGVRIGMIHDSGARTGRERRLRRRFGDCAVVVFGHSHQPSEVDGIDGQLLLNPGSPTQRRREEHHTLGLLDLADGAIVSHSIVELD